jgi:hypothetical protein
LDRAIGFAHRRDKMKRPDVHIHVRARQGFCGKSEIKSAAGRAGAIQQYLKSGIDKLLAQRDNHLQRGQPRRTKTPRAAPHVTFDR